MAHSNRKQRSLVRRAQKQSRKAEWATKIGTSRNKKLKAGNTVRKRTPSAKVPTPVLVKVKGKLVTALRAIHAGPACGNTGCKRCAP